ncbi:MAG: hypothetical protein ACYC56_14785, partial [Candidatus Aquicultor sp.]
LKVRWRKKLLIWPFNRPLNVPYKEFLRNPVGMFDIKLLAVPLFGQGRPKDEVGLRGYRYYGDSKPAH